MERFHIQEAFTTLKPLCVSLMKDPNVNNAHNVSEAVSNVSDKVIQDLLEYLMLPLITHLSNKSLSNNVKEELVRTTKTILSKARISKLEYFNKLYACLLFQIYDSTQQTMLIESHEELKEAVLSCVKTLIHCCFTEVMETLYTKENASKLGQGILLSITIARTEKSRSLRLLAIETLMALCQVDDETDTSDIILQDQVANVIMLFLPGIASGLQEVAMGGEIQGHKLTMIALRAWSRIISLVMKDESVEDVAPSLDTLITENIHKVKDASPPKDHNDVEKHLKTAIRSQEWFYTTATKLNVLVQQLDELKNHSHYKVRKELAESISLLLRTCSRNMKPNVMLLIEYLISLSEDDVVEVREESTKALSIINRNYMQNKNMRPLVELLEENFYSVLTKLPRIIRRCDDREQLSCFNQVAGYLKLLGKERLPRMMVSVSHLRRLILALVYASEIDCSNISLLQGLNVQDLEDPAYSYGSHLWRRFKFIQNHFCEEKVVKICQYLGEFGDFQILVDSLLELIRNVPQHRKELILLLNWMTYVPLNDSSALTLYKEIVELYTSPELWYPTIEVTEDVPLRIAQSNVVQCCLLLEGLGYIAQNLKRGYDTFLLKTLYLVIERAGSSHALVSFVGVQTLERIAVSQQHKTVGDLLRANVDYFSYHVTIKLRRVERNPGVLDVVGVVMKYSTMDVLPCLKEIVNDVFLQMKNSFQKKNSYSFLKVFYLFIICIKRLVRQEHDKGVENQSTIIESKSSKVIQFLLEHYNAKKIDEKIEDDIDSENEEQLEGVEEEEEEGKAKSLPPYVKMIEEVMKHCLNFLPSKDVQKSVLAMSTLQEGLEILAQCEDVLLPIVHLLWHPLIDRFHNENPLIINRAWQLLNVLGRLSKDFIRSRTLRQVLPALSKFLDKSAKESYKKNLENVYKFTQTYKTQKELLSTLSQIVKNLRLQERELWKILTVAEPYLSKHQHPTLQVCCVQFYKDIADYNGDICLIKCLSIWNSKISKIASDSSFNIKQLQIDETISTNEYCKNVQDIMKYIQDKDTVLET